MAGTTEQLEKRCELCEKGNLLNSGDSLQLIGSKMDAIHPGKIQIQRLCLTTGDVYLRGKPEFTRGPSAPCIKPKEFEPKDP